MVTRILLLLILLTSGAQAESLRFILPDTHPVTGEMIRFTIRGEYRERIALETLTFPDSDAYDWVQLARDSWTDERVDGLMAKVFERHIALFPRHAGPLRIGPVVHRLTVVAGKGGREVREVRAEPVTIQVAPFPASSVPLASSALTVVDELSSDPGTLRDGETLIRRVVLRADDTLPHLVPPRPEIRAPWLISFTAPEVRKMKPTPAGPETTVVWEWHLRPKTGEPAVLPPVSIPWFDTVSREMKTAEIPAIPFGYASFSKNRTGSDQLASSQVLIAIGVLLTGLLTGLAAAFWASGLRLGQNLIQRLRRLLPFDPTRSPMRIAARQRDLMALRSAVEGHLNRKRTLGLPVADGSTRDLDQAIYAKPSSASAFEPDSFLRGLLSRNRKGS
ncbi:BatD family protein [Roseibium suaedae]|uniref:Oxygen tolerance n=1 Tax=Roseibium suaedae TaxID=735517 RepID=A0A1M7NMV4_9HYPH|nr:BatD family protein [Roseibium suaedae]SHN05272.1 Oxygen tolerance [Roseibium suaedae]